MSNKKKMDKYAKRRLVLKIIVAILIVLIIYKIFFKIKPVKNEDTVLVLGGEVQELENRIIVDSLKNIYLSLDDVKKIYDENLYYDEVNEKVITTFNKHIAILNLDEKEIVINDAKSNINGALRKMENELYLPFSDMEIVYDFEYNYCESSNTVIVDSISNEKITAKALKKVSVKNKPGAFSKKLAKLNVDEEVTVLEKQKKCYKIRTSTGLIGYVNAKKIGEPQSIRKEMNISKLKDVEVLFNYSDISGNYNEINVNSDKYNVVVPNIFSISENKNIELKITPTSEKYKKYISLLEKNNINLWATITNDVEVSKIMLTYDERKEVINNIYYKLIENNYKVLNINFEKINDINSFYRFLIELTPRLREAGIKTVVTYNDVMNEEKVLKIVDYLVKDE
ncbi:MAG: SH3 domain-containing protein [Clostridia bacterium]|nr:SH3 domain-containing protein [Clostridia bacterium]